MPKGHYKRKGYHARMMTATAPTRVHGTIFDSTNWRKLLRCMKETATAFNYTRIEIEDNKGTTIGAWEWRNKGDEMIGQLNDVAMQSGWYNVEA